MRNVEVGQIVSSTGFNLKLAQLSQRNCFVHFRNIIFDKVIKNQRVFHCKAHWQNQWNPQSNSSKKHRVGHSSLFGFFTPILFFISGFWCRFTLSNFDGFDCGGVFFGLILTEFSVFRFCRKRKCSAFFLREIGCQRMDRCFYIHTDVVFERCFAGGYR